jgi:hypothetical protein
MPFNSSGQYNLPAGSIVADGTTIDAADLNTPLQDIEASLSQTVLRNGAAPLTGPLSAGGNKVTNLANGTVSADAVNLGQVNTLLAGKANLSGGNTFSGNQTINGFARFGSYGGTFQGVTIANNSASGTALGVAFVDFQNENSIATADIFGAMETDGSSNIRFGTTPPGSRTTDRRVERFRIDGTGALGFGGANFGTFGQIPISNGSGSPPTWGSHINLGTAVNTTSGTAIDFTGIPAGVKRIQIMLSGVSLSGAAIGLVRLGTSAGYVASGYGGNISYVFSSSVGGSSQTTGIGFGLGNSGDTIAGGLMTLINLTGNVWVASYTGSLSGSSQGIFSTSTVTLPGALDRLRFTSSNGTDTYDAGVVNILWEF